MTGTAVLILARLIVLAAATAAGFALGPSLGSSEKSVWLAGAGLALGLGVILIELWARRIPVERLFWGAAGGIVGMAFGFGLGSAVGALVPGARQIGRGLFALLFTYLGSVVALAKRDELEATSEKLFRRTARGREPAVILDTSVIIDGRIADVCASGFVEGALLVPQFVLRELQHVADSPDGLRRNRAKRGFDTLQRLQQIARVDVRIDARDFPDTAEVDEKLIELARATGGKLLTNDYALRKLAEVSGAAVLDMNELARALRPAVQPGEPMHVRVVREGKEVGQGVAYLDDGTMVVVDHGKPYIGQTVDVAVTTMLQTAGGRMIFARLREEEPAQR